MKRYLVVRSIKRQLLFLHPPIFRASTDGVVLEECLKEVKMIFSRNYDTKRSRV